MTHTIWVYGTLRPGNGEVVQASGRMYDLGWFPGVKLGGQAGGPVADEPGTVTFERLTVPDLAKYDRYEGFNPDDPDNSLYLRVPFLDGWTYVYNHSVDGRPEVVSGDWLAYTGQKKGSYHHE